MNRTLGLIIISLVLTQVSDFRDWRGIVPLRSTRAEVEKLLGPPEKSTSATYRSEDGTVTVRYADRVCDYGWQVPLETVISFSVYPKHPVALADMKLDERKFEKRRDVHNESVYYYINQGEGVNYTVDTGKEVVTLIEYYPSARENNRRCKTATDSSSSTKEAPTTAEPTITNRGRRVRKSGKP